MNEIKFKILEIENFRNYEKIDFNFEPNRFCVITGPNGSGKTTLAIDAICWCLFDETSKGRKGDSIIRKRSGKNTRVCLTFSIDNDDYKIENNRKHDEYGDSKIIYKNGSSITGATRKETNNIISSILMPKDVFKNCLLFSQYINKPFAEMGDTGQKNIFDLMMGFEKFNRYYDNSKDYIKNIEKELKILNEELLLLDKSAERNKDLLDSEIEDNKRTIDDFNNRKMNLELEIADLIDINNCLKRNISKKDEILEEYKNIQENISNIKLELNTLNTKLDNEKRLLETKIFSEKKDKKDKVEKEYSEKLLSIDKELDSINNMYNILKEEINTKNESLKSEYYQKKEDIETPIRTKLDILTEEYRTAQKESQVLKTSMESIQKDIDSLLKAIEDMDNKLNQEIPICFACKQEIKGDNLEEIKIIYNEKNSSLEKDQININHIKSKILEIREVISKKEKNIDDVNKKKEEELQKLENWKISVLEKLSEYKDFKLKNLKTKEIELGNKKDIIINEIEGYLRSIEYEYENMLLDKIKELEYNTKDDIIKLEETLKDLNDSRILKEELIEKVNNIHTQISSNEGFINAKRDELNTIIPLHKNYLKNNNIKLEKLKNIVEQDTEKNISINNDIKKYERKLLISKFWKIAFSPKGIRAILLDDSIPTLNGKAKELSIATDCIRVTFDSQKLLESGESRNQFCVNPIQTKNLTDKREDFSQGEGRMVDIITLLSLRHLLEVTYERKFNISLFDEILDSLYKDNAEIVIDFLKKMSEDSCTILITHTLKNYIDPDEHLELGR